MDILCRRLVIWFRRYKFDKKYWYNDKFKFIVLNKIIREKMLGIISMKLNILRLNGGRKIEKRV